MIKASASISIQYDNPYAPFKGREWKKAMDWAADAGFDAVELIFSDPNLIDTDEVCRYLEKKGLGVATLATGQCASLEGIFMTSPSESVRNAAYKRLCDDIDFSVKLGRPYVTVGLIRGRGGALDIDSEMEILGRELLRICEYADKNGVTLNLEPLNLYETRLINTVGEGKAFLESIGAPECCGLLYDTFHSNIGDRDVLEAFKSCYDRINHVHFSDSNRRLPGEGNYDYAALMRVINELGYDNYVSLEVYNIPSAEHIIKHAAEKLFAALGR